MGKQYLERLSSSDVLGQLKWTSGKMLDSAATGFRGEGQFGNSSEWKKKVRASHCHPKTDSDALDPKNIAAPSDECTTRIGFALFTARADPTHQIDTFPTLWFIHLEIERKILAFIYSLILLPEDTHLAHLTRIKFLSIKLVCPAGREKDDPDQVSGFLSL